MNQPNPVQRFLGLPRVAESPFELLGVTPGACDDQRVREALARRLARVRRHPESLSHEADEVRLALYAAAAQLMDPSVRAELVRPRPSSDGATSASPADDGIDAIISHVIARAGGWNTECRRWLALLAHAHGMGEHELRDRLQHLSGPQRGAPASRGARPAGSVAEAPRSARRTGRRGLSVGAVVMIVSTTTLAAIVVGALVLRETARSASTPLNSTPPVQAPHPGAHADRSLREPVAPEQAAASPAREALASPDAVVRRLERAHEELPKDPGQAAWRFERAVEALAGQWTQLGRSARQRADGLVRGFIHRVQPDSASGVRALGAISDGVEKITDPADPINAEAVRAAVWSAATLSALHNDPDADRRVRRRAADRLHSALRIPPPPAGSFEDSALTAAPAVARRMSDRFVGRSAPGDESWRAWVECVDRSAGASAGAIDRRDNVILRAAEDLLESRPGVAESPAANSALRTLLSSVRWRAGGGDAAALPAHAAVLAWFDEPAIRTRDLAAVTEWIVAESGAPGVRTTMTLGRASIPESRVALRDRYARAWGMVGATDAHGFAVVWARTARETIDAIPAGAPAAALARAAVAANLNTAAALRWMGRTSDASAILIDPLSSALNAQRFARPRVGAVRRADPSRDGVWAVAYLGSRRGDAPERVRLLAQIGRRPGPLGPVDADTLAGAALRSPTGTLRDRAQEVVRLRASEPGVIAALLDNLTVSPRNDSTTALVQDAAGSSIIAPSEPTWPFVVRRALVDRLLTVLAPRDEASAIDGLTAVLAQAYASRLVGAEDAAPKDAGFGAERANDAAPVAAQPGASRIDALWKRWLRAARRLAPNPRAPLSITQIERRASGRIRLARGPAERFAAFQLSIADAMVFVITTERPSSAARIRVVRSELSARRRAAPSLVDQILDTELAMLRLWAIRLGLDPDDPIPTGLALPVAAPAPVTTEPIDPLDLLTPAMRATPAGEAFHDRLAALNPADPQATFELAEDLAAIAGAPAWRDAARRLFVLSYEEDQRLDTPLDLGPSVCLALAHLSTRADDRRWLLALAISLDPALARTVDVPTAASASSEARLALAEALELYRLGEYRRALDRLDKPGVRALLERYGPMLTGGAGAVLAELSTEPTCRQCHNRRIVPNPADPGGPPTLCPTCGGDPGPDLSDTMLIEELRVERALLSRDPASWSVALAITRGKPVRDVEPNELLRADP